jgi:succinate dehydrogenase/fumarate reductase flavoprotein subunit
VVVIGFGGAGASTAVSAADSGAKVLLLEKAPEGEEGGNTRYALQLVLIPKDKEAGILYFKGLRGLYEDQSDEVIELIVTETMANQDWLIKTMGANPDTITHRLMREYPELPGAEEAVDGIFVEPGFWNSSLWNLLRKNVYDRKDKIDVWYESPAVRLIQDPVTKIIHGVVTENKGKRYNIRAKNGVVLACGGFENNDAMLENYAQLSNAYSKGAKYNTGDGVKMAIDVGADLWHMSTLAGPDVNFVNPETGRAQFYGLQLPAESYRMTGFMGQSAIFIGGDGTRFTNEAGFPRHGHYNYGGTWFSLLVPNNSWCVFDETARLGRPAYFQWSQGMEEEIAKGWIIKANTLAELAAKMNVPAENFAKEVAEYNQFCQNKYDVRFKRAEPFLKPIASSGPYYAFPIRATLTNTQGGARRNIECEVQNVWGESIPHLYSAGEFGSFYCDVYNGGGNLSECLFTGRIAGRNASAVKRDTDQGSILDKTPLDLSSAALSYTTGPNQYLGRAMGIGSELVVRVTYTNGKIEKVEILSHNETPSISDRAIAEIPAAIVKANSTEVDAVTGVTTTSNAIKKAVAEAIAGVR